MTCCLLHIVVNVEYSWSIFQSIMKDKNVNMPEQMPALLTYLYLILHIVREQQPDHLELCNVGNIILKERESPSTHRLLALMKKFKNVKACNKYIKAGEDCAKRQSDKELINVLETAQTTSL